MDSLAVFHFEPLVDNVKDNGPLRSAWMKEAFDKETADAYIKDCRDSAIALGHASEDDETVGVDPSLISAPSDWDFMASGEIPTDSGCSAEEDEIASADEVIQSLLKSSSISGRTSKTESFSSESGFSDGDEPVNSGCSAVSATPTPAMNHCPIHQDQTMQMPSQMIFSVPPPPYYYAQPFQMPQMAPPMPMFPMMANVMQMYVHNPEFQRAYLQALPYYQQLYGQNRF